MARLPRLVLPELPSHVKAGILPAALLMLSAHTGGASEQRLPHIPFAAWAAETAPERELDRLISEVVARLEQGDVRFSQWRSRDIRAEFGRLRLTVPHTTEGRYLGRNFLFENDRVGVHFRARLGLRQLPLFVPSACRERVQIGRRGDEVRLRGEEFPGVRSAHAPPDPDGERRRSSSTVFTYEMACGTAVRIRFYDSATESLRHRLPNGETGQHAPDETYWTGVTIFRAAD